MFWHFLHTGDGDWGTVHSRGRPNSQHMGRPPSTDTCRETPHSTPTATLRLTAAFIVIALACHAKDDLSLALQSAFIGSPAVASGAQAYLVFRRSFVLDRVPDSAQLHLFADSRFLLWVNGTHVLRGPCRFNPKRPEFDTLELRRWLRPGTNALAVLVHSYPAVNGRIMRHAPGLTVVLEADGREALRTDSSWRTCAATEYLPSPGAWGSIPDVIDGRKSPGDWMAAAYSDGAWEHAVPVDGEAWGAFQPRSTPLPMETVLPAPRVMPAAAPLQLPLELRGDAARTERPAQPAKDGVTSVVMDLGQTAMAYPRIELEADDGSVLQLQYALRYRNGRPTETYGGGTTYTARAGRQSFVGADQWCARYVTVSCPTGCIRLLTFEMTERRYPFERLGRFSCSDPVLTKLWEMALNTIECTSDDAYGSDARERNEWVQDSAKASFSATRVAEAGPNGQAEKVYSDPRLLRNTLRHAALSQNADGQLLGTFPTDRGPEDCHYVIEDYNCQWVEGLRTYYEATGDANFVRELWPQLDRQMEWFLRRRTPRGLVLAREYTSFDNPLAYLTCEGATLNAFVYQALRDAESLALALGEKQDVNRYGQAADALFAAFNGHLWDESARAYSSGYLDNARLGPTVHAQLMALHSGVVTSERRAAVETWFLANYKNASMTHCGSNPDSARMIATKAGLGMPVMYYWAFHALYRMDREDTDSEALKEMRRRWQPIVDHFQDAGTLPESFVDQEGNGASESCHNYGAVPAYFLSSYVLGVRRNGPVRDKQLIIEPHLADLTEARGVVVTEFGPVAAAWQREGQALHFQLDVPASVTVALRLPEGDAATLECSGESIAPRQTGRYATAALGPGKHRGSVKRAAAHESRGTP